MPLLVGTSGWQYKDWRGVLYPPGLPQKRWLEGYARGFATVESNNAFYRLPSKETFAAWRDRTPDGFVMAVKASRFLTHMKRLRDPEEPVGRLMAHVAGLGDRLGPVLLQLPPTLCVDAAALDTCLCSFPPGTRIAVEPRHDSWWCAEVREVLENRGAAMCWADLYARPMTPLWRTTGWGYLRFHGGRAQPWSRYGRQSLTTWVRRVADTWSDQAEVYVYFNNDPGGAAVLDAVAFTRVASAAGRTTTRTPQWVLSGSESAPAERLSNEVARGGPVEPVASSRSRQQG